MSSTKNILKPLFDLGLSKYEAKVYLTLISEGISSAKSISDITGVPYGKVYEIINSLTFKGFALILPSKPMKYRAISPLQAIDFAKKESCAKFNRLEDLLFSNLQSLFIKNKNFSESKSSFGIISGRSNVVNKTEELIGNAQKSINIHCSANSLSRLTLHKDVLKQAFDSGVKISIAGITNKVVLDEVSSLNFCCLRHISSSVNNFLSVDGRECLIIDVNPDDDNILYGRDLGLFASSSSFTSFLDSFFKVNFKRAREINFE